MIDLQALINKTFELEPLSPSVSRLATLIGNDDVNLKEIENVIKYDSTLTLRVLRAANSAMMASNSATTSIHDALLRLGAGAVLALAVSSVAQNQMKQSLPQYGLSEGELWRHSVACALAAELASRHTPLSIPPVAFTAALLHDIGKQAVAQFIDPEVQRILCLAQKDGKLTPLEAEKEILRVHHGEIGGLIAQHWNLPDRIVQAISFHHHPLDQSDIVCDVVYMSDVIADLVMGREADAPPVAECNQVRERLQITPEKFDLWGEKLREKIKDVSSRYE
jgi:putative nucleotidyltransferase with HDIG domain